VVSLLPAGVTGKPILGPLDVTLKAGTITHVYAVGTDDQPNRWSSALTTDIDRFLLVKLEEKQLAFSPPAARHTFLRRLYFDLSFRALVVSASSQSFRHRN